MQKIVLFKLIISVDVEMTPGTSEKCFELRPCGQHLSWTEGWVLPVPGSWLLHHHCCVPRSWQALQPMLPFVTEVLAKYTRRHLSTLQTLPLRISASLCTRKCLQSHPAPLWTWLAFTTSSLFQPKRRWQEQLYFPYLAVWLRFKP